jgi:hypothetical protein
MTQDIVLGLLDLMLRMRLTRDWRPWKFSAVLAGLSLEPGSHADSSDGAPEVRFSFDPFALNHGKNRTPDPAAR